MPDKLLLHPQTEQRLTRLLASQPHGILISGPAGSGKETFSRTVAASLLDIPSAKLASYPYMRIIDPADKTISIEAIRELQPFLKLKIPVPAAINRLVIIARAERMGQEAQNALLKTLEEPPAGTVIILTAESTLALLPTILSRVVELPLLPVSQAQAEAFYKDTHKDADIKRHYALSQGQAGLLAALLADEDHPLIQAVAEAKQLLGLPAAERLLMTDELAKDKDRQNLLLNALQRITHAALVHASQADRTAAVRQWHQRQTAVVSAIGLTRHNPNAKLLLDTLFLSL